MSYQSFVVVLCQYIEQRLIRLVLLGELFNVNFIYAYLELIFLKNCRLLKLFIKLLHFYTNFADVCACQLFHHINHRVNLSVETLKCQFQSFLKIDFYL